MCSAMKHPSIYYYFIVQTATNLATENRLSTAALNEELSKYVIDNSIFCISVQQVQARVNLQPTDCISFG